MSESVIKETGLLSPGKLVLQLLGFAVGVALLVWIIHGAIEQGKGEEINAWDHLRGADPLLVIAMLACTLISAVINGSTFWITVRPMKRLRFWDLQCLNLVGNMLNYAPVRLGAIARVLYHMHVDRMGLLQIGGWFAFIGYMLALGAGSCLLATIIHDSVDWIWGALVLGQMILGGLILRVVVGNQLITRHGRGIDRIIADGRAVWGAIGLRLLDLSAYTGRMAIALAILQIELPVSHIVVLAIVALASSLIPFGRLGFREFCVAITASRLSMLQSDVELEMNALALIESAGEMLVFIPLGAVALLWYRKRWGQAAEGAKGIEAGDKSD